MAKPKKFGAFSGVFTPSVLTILGVIMYMRLGWVVGSAGLITALVIIVISHVISLTTGLSISSVATDKKIKTGGIYYILSRSLGFPMGGAIGIALFTGTALGISLYLVGFAESLLAVDNIREFLHLKQDVNSYRIVGSIALLFLVTIAFISTSLAIKTQYIVLGAIALSLVSIFAGFFINSNFAPETISFTPSREGISIQIVFGVFFPAVTGFTAGVAMSGDLRNPKKDIPVGTLASIFVGFIIYVGLAISFAVFVNRDLLIQDPNFLLKISYIPALVIAGIWGATLSSALGGILGGPRILQAISKDKITPKIFAKGYGESNEPRNALIFIALIAEGGILIGELNVIAAVVSMFYLASYGFINLAFFLENWASTDFRPSFKVKGVVGLIGFIASFGVMAQLGMLSMIAALVIMFGLFAWLNRKQMKSESGDVWQSVWLSVVRRALHSLDKKTLEHRNWQPNVILFSGGKGQRPHLLEFGKNLVGQYGLLSNFDLHESKEKKYLFPKYLQSQFNEDNEQGIFTRRQTCSDIYTGIETIISTYGFSGIEPNTVILGWMRQSKNPVRFSKMINRIHELDINLLLIDYDKKHGYGNYKTVDIWWRGSGNNGNLALNLMKFLWKSDDWADAKLRLLVGNPINEKASEIRKLAEQVLSNMRIDAEIKIINNQIEQKPFFELIRTESLKTDLIILGMPEITEGKEEEFVKLTNKLMFEIGTVVLIKASSQFKDQSLGFKRENEQNNINISNIQLNNEEAELILPGNTVADENVISLHKDLSNINNDFFNSEIKPIFYNLNELTNNITLEIETLRKDKISKLKEYEGTVLNNKIVAATDMFLKKTLIYINNYSSNNENEKNIFSKLINNIENLISQLAVSFICSNPYADLRKRKAKNYNVKFKKLVRSYLPYNFYSSYYQVFEEIGKVFIKNIIKLQINVKEIRNSLLKLKTYAQEKNLNQEKVNSELELIGLKLDTIKDINSKNEHIIYNLLNSKTVNIINKISSDIKNYNSKNRKLEKFSSKKVEHLKEQLKQTPSFLMRNEELLKNNFKLEIQLIDFENKLYRISRKTVIAVEEFINVEVLLKIKNIESNLKDFVKDFEKNTNTEFKSKEFPNIPSEEVIFNSFKKILDIKFEKLKYLTDKFPEKISLLSNESFNNISDKQFLEIEITELPVSYLLNYLIQSEYNTPLIKIAEELPEQIIKIENSAQNILRVILFTFFDADGKRINKDENSDEKLIDYFKNKIIELNELETKTKLKIENINRKINERLSEISNNLSVYSLLNLASTNKRFSKNKKKTKKFNEKITKIKSSISNQFNQIWYRHSDAVIFRKKLSGNAKKPISNINACLNLVEKVSARNEIINKLPFYYQQLFLRTNNYSKDFFKGRKNEITEILKSINRYKSSYYGAILIKGDRYSGKTFLTQYAINTLMPNSKVYSISPPLEGSVSIKTFKTKLANEFDAKGSYERKFAKIQNGSVIIFDEVELWWEKTETGFEVINEIIELIKTYGHKFLFILNINSYAYKLINITSNIEPYFLNIVDCKPFNAKLLKEAILFRHNSGGIPFIYKEKMQEDLRQAEFAKLFAKYFNYSQGNIGVALISWIANIIDYSENIIKIKSVKTINVEILDNFDTETYMILSQFILHKRLTISKMARVMMFEETNAEDYIAYLKRSGLIKEIIKGVFEINKYMFIHIKQKLEELGIC